MQAPYVELPAALGDALVWWAQVPRCVPWSLAPSGTQRAVEGVRPVFWQLRPKSYLARTQGWAAFPTTR